MRYGWYNHELLVAKLDTLRAENALLQKCLDASQAELWRRVKEDWDRQNLRGVAREFGVLCQELRQDLVYPCACGVMSQTLREWNAHALFQELPDGRRRLHNAPPGECCDELRKESEGQ